MSRVALSCSRAISSMDGDLEADWPTSSPTSKSLSSMDGGLEVEIPTSLLPSKSLFICQNTYVPVTVYLSPYGSSLTLDTFQPTYESHVTDSWSHLVDSLLTLDLPQAQYHNQFSFMNVSHIFDFLDSLTSRTCRLGTESGTVQSRGGKWLVVDNGKRIRWLGKSYNNLPPAGQVSVMCISRSTTRISAKSTPIVTKNQETQLIRPKQEFQIVIVTQENSLKPADKMSKIKKPHSKQEQEDDVDLQEHDRTPDEDPDPRGLVCEQEHEDDDRREDRGWIPGEGVDSREDPDPGRERSTFSRSGSDPVLGDSEVSTGATPGVTPRDVQTVRLESGPSGLPSLSGAPPSFRNFRCSSAKRAADETDPGSNTTSGNCLQDTIDPKDCSEEDPIDDNTQLSGKRDMEHEEEFEANPSKDLTTPEKSTTSSGKDTSSVLNSTGHVKELKGTE